MEDKIREKIIRMYHLGYTVEQLILIVCGVSESDIKKVIKEEKCNE